MRRLGLVFLALALALALPFVLWGDAFETALSPTATRDWLAGFGAWAWALGIGLLAADLVLPIPGSAVMAALGMLYGPWLGGVIAAVGSFTSGVVAYGLCRAFGRRAFTWLVGADGRAQAERLFDAGGAWVVAGSRWLPILPETVACLAGCVAMDARRFLLALACGSVPLGVAFAWLGHLGTEAPLSTLLASALLPLLLWALVRPLLRRLEAQGENSRLMM